MSAKPLTQQVVDDVGGAFTVGLAYIGDRLGLFATLAVLGRAPSEQVAQAAGLNERYVREWLKAMVASRYVDYDPAGTAYFLNDEQRAAFVDENAATFAGGVFQFALPSLLMAPQLLQVFRTGGGIAYGDLPPEVPEAIDRMHRPWFNHLLVQQWIPGVPGLVARLERGISVLDVGCGAGRSTTALAGAFPRSSIVGLDPHEPSVAAARATASAAGLTNAAFVASTIETLRPETPFDLVLAIDCIHDMFDPTGALCAIRQLLAPDGMVLWSEPTGSRNPLENRTPAGKMRSNLSPFHCLTVSLACGGAGLGTIIGEEGARELAAAAGFEHFEKLAIDNAMQQFFALRSRAQQIR